MFAYYLYAYEEKTTDDGFFYVSAGLQYGFTKRAVEIKPPAAFKLATDPLLPSHPLALRSPALQSNNAMTLSVSSSLVLLTAEDKHTRETYNMNADKSKSIFLILRSPNLF